MIVSPVMDGGRSGGRVELRSGQYPPQGMFHDMGRPLRFCGRLGHVATKRSTSAAIGSVAPNFSASRANRASPWRRQVAHLNRTMIQG